MDLQDLREGEIFLQFIRVRDAWYTQSEILGEGERERLYGQEEFGFYAKRVVEGKLEQEGTEFFVRWRKVGDEEVPRLEAYNDAWEMLPYFGHMLAALGDKKITADQFQEALLSSGLLDVTERRPLTTRDQELFDAAKGLPKDLAKRKAKP